ncbi:MAG: NADH-quinone oxidoreductase subunit NuoE [Elusimicrobiota bacterium]
MIAEKTKKIVEKEKRGRRALIAILQKVQSDYSYLPAEALDQISLSLEIPPAEVYSVATFYKTFGFQPRGKHSVTVCLGTACHVRGGARIAEELSGILNIKSGETTDDGEYSLETVNCLGCCAIGPVLMMDGKFYGQMTPLKVRNLFKGPQAVGK